MKIICVIDDLVSGGAQRQMTELAVGMTEKGHNVTIIIYNKELFFLDFLESNGVKVEQIIEKNYFKRIYKIRKYIRCNNPDSVLAFMQVPSFIATLAGFPFRKWKLVVGERNADPIILKSKKQKFYRYFHLFVNNIIGNSQANIDLVKKVNPLIPENKFRVFYNIIDSNKFNCIDDIIIDKSSLSKTKIAVVGRYEFQKNYLGLIEAINYLPIDVKNRLEIECYGVIKENNKYLQLIYNKLKEYNLQDIIKINPATKNISYVYQSSDFIALVSHFEGFPNVICEAMACSKPVIVTKVSDVPLLLKEDINGFLCDSNNILSIKNAFIKALNTTTEERKIIGNNNKKLVEDTFSREKIVNLYLEILK